MNLCNKKSNNICCVSCYTIKHTKIKSCFKFKNVFKVSPSLESTMGTVGQKTITPSYKWQLRRISEGRLTTKDGS